MQKIDNIIFSIITNNTNFTIKNLTTGQNIFLINTLNKSSNLYYRTHCSGDFSVSGIFSNTVSMVGGSFRTVTSNTGTQYTTAHIGYKLIRRKASISFDSILKICDNFSIV